MQNLWILLLIELLFFFCFFILNKQDIMAPSVIMSVVFIFSTSVALINGEKWNIQYSFWATMLISLGLFCFGVTDVIIANICSKRKGRSIQISLQPIYFVTWKIILIIIVDILIVILAYGEVKRIAATNTWFSNIFYAYRIITSHSDNLSSDQYMNGMISQASKIVIVSGFLFAYVFIYNVMICKEKLKDNILLMVSPILLCLMTLISGVRTNILRLVVFCLICGYIMLQYKKNWKIKTSWRFIKVLAFSAIVALVLFGILQSVLGRTDKIDIFNVISNYAGAPIQHFNQFIQEPPPPNSVFGQETLVGIRNFLYKLGLNDKSYSAFEEYRHLDANNYGNVYTIFRKFIQDYNVLGMCFATMVTAAIFSYMYNGKIKNRDFTYKRMIEIVVYGYMFYIIAMASIDNFVHDYLSFGSLVLYIWFRLLCWCCFRLKINFSVVRRKAIQ